MENKRIEKTGLMDGVGVIIKDGIERRRGNPLAIFADGMILITAFLFARCHIAFGAYPLATAFVSLLPIGVWIALIGAIVGSLTLGKIGIIHAIICVVAVFLRVIISGGRGSGGETFKEPLTMRISVAMIAAFVGGAYEILLSGFVLSAVVYLCFSVLSAAVFTFALSGIFDAGIDLNSLVLGDENVFANRKNRRETFSSYLFQATALLYIFLISLSLRSYSFFGITPAYVFSAFITLLVAKRFGGIRGVTVGFISSFGISGVYAVAFALVGLGAGVVFPAGIAYALSLGGGLLCAWSYYSAGVIGILTTLPEFIFAAMISLPVLRKTGATVINKETDTEEGRVAKDMVTATALAYKSGIDHGSASIERMFSRCSGTLRNISEGERGLLYEEYEGRVISAIRGFCRDCNFYDRCVAENPAPCVECVEALATMLYKKEKIFPDDSTALPRYCHNGEALISELERAVAEAEMEKEKRRKVEAIADEYEICSRLVAEVARYYERERMQNTALSEKMCDIIRESGLPRCEARVFGDRKKHIIIAGEDKDGGIVTSPELHARIESAAGIKLGDPEYYRNGDYALLECSGAPMYSVEFSTAQRNASGVSVSGDSVASFEDGDGRFYSLIADGMGSGDLARRTSRIARDLLSNILAAPCSKSTAFHILNHVVRSRCEECSTSVDLFDFDLITGEGVFYKCGAAASYVKRDGSIFRIRSETAPIGIMKNIDAERIRVEVRGGDWVVMISDGISQTVEDSAWLLEFLSKPVTTDVASYATAIVDEAVKRGRIYDDLTVAVVRIIKL